MRFENFSKNLTIHDFSVRMASRASEMLFASVSDASAMVHVSAPACALPNAKFTASHRVTLASAVQTKRKSKRRSIPRSLIRW